MILIPTVESKKGFRLDVFKLFSKKVLDGKRGLPDARRVWLAPLLVIFLANDIVRHKGGQAPRRGLRQPTQKNP